MLILLLKCAAIYAAFITLFLLWMKSAKQTEIPIPEDYDENSYH
jgi:hypothetical protein